MTHVRIAVTIYKVASVLGVGGGMGTSPLETEKELQNIAKITILNIREIQVLLQHRMRH